MKVFIYLFVGLFLFMSSIGCESSTTDNDETTEIKCTDAPNFSIVMNDRDVTYLEFETWGEGNPFRNVVRWSKEPFDLIKEAREQQVFFQIQIDGCWANVSNTPFANFAIGWDVAVEQVSKLLIE